ncbi:hypothetical protein MTR67_007190 [Solanum verrucosum]|uniref:Uncharacterized protein n=1 Tax=Solanum verrucosum TaxID=315347 RepID=A0AAF0Q1L0_SOLVR|nr:hypothetical protein MTR67_007190 [Solanum verrucosum]
MVLECRLCLECKLKV